MLLSVLDKRRFTVHPADVSKSANTHNRVNVEAVNPTEAHDHGLRVAHQAKALDVGNPFGHFLEQETRKSCHGATPPFQMEGGVGNEGRKQFASIGRWNFDIFFQNADVLR